MSIFAPDTLVVSRLVDIERRARFIGEAERAGIGGWAFFDAFDGPGMGLSSSRPTECGRHKRPSPDPLSPGEIGCLLSHVAIWRAARAMCSPRICVMEDDVEFGDLGAWQPLLDALPADWLMVHGAQDHVVDPEPVNDICSRVKHSYGTHFMLLSREAISTLAAQPVTMALPADWMLRPLFDTGRVYCPTQPLVRHLNSPGAMP